MIIEQQQKKPIHTGSLCKNTIRTHYNEQVGKYEIVPYCESFPYRESNN